MLKRFLPSRKKASATYPERIILEGIEFSLTHTKRKNMKRMLLRVENKNHIRLSSSGVSKKRLEAFVNENKRWILQQQARLKEPFAVDSPFYYLGNIFLVRHHAGKLYMEEGSVFLNPLTAKFQSDEFYKNAAKQYLPARLEFWSKEMGLQFNRLRFRLAKTRWGSCNCKKEISLNPYMMKLSNEMIDYIIVHELAHLVHLNHSKAFHSLIEAYLPNHRLMEKEIKHLSWEIARG